MKKSPTVSGLQESDCQDMGACASSAVGSTAPSLEALEYIQGEPVTYGKVHHGPVMSYPGVVVIEFWATWCPPCRTSIPHLNQLYKKFQERGVQFVGVTREERTTVVDFIQEFGPERFSYPVAHDNLNLSNQLSVRGIPVAFIVDQNQTIIWQGHPMRDLEREIEKALGGDPFS